MAHAQSESFSGRFRWATGLLGFGFGGFFDGILLHQILQWHHLLSAIRQGPLADLRGQVLADGLFHALMYLVAAIGLLQLARSRGELARPGAGRELLSGFLVGFGVWHVVDAVLSHWLTGIHRIRMEANNPLAWDLLWLLVFGLVPLAVALWQRGRRSPGGGAGVTAALLVAAATGIAGAIAARPADPTLATITVVLRAQAEPARLLGSLAASDTRILWSDRRGTVWVLKAGPALSRLDLYRAGALFVSGMMLPAGCSAFLR